MLSPFAWAPPGRARGSSRGYPGLRLRNNFDKLRQLRQLRLARSTLTSLTSQTSHTRAWESLRMRRLRLSGLSKKSCHGHVTRPVALILGLPRSIGRLYLQIIENRMSVIFGMTSAIRCPLPDAAGNFQSPGTPGTSAKTDKVEERARSREEEKVRNT